MIGKFFKEDEQTFVFVVREPEFDDDSYTFASCDPKAHSIWVCNGYEKPEGKSLHWEDVPRSFLSFCMSRYPRLFEKANLHLKGK